MTEKKKVESAPTTFKSKSKARTGRHFVAITLLVEETGTNNRRRSTAKTKAGQPLIVDYFKNYLEQGYSYGFGDWAVKSFELTEDEFKNAYDAL